MQRKIIIFMKKYLFIATFMLALIGFTSCDGSLSSETWDLTIKKADWKWDDVNEQYYYHFDVPQITKNVLKHGTFTVSHVYNYDTDDIYLASLPESVYCSETNSTTGITTYYTQHIEAFIGLKWVEIVLTNSDYQYSGQNPETMHFRMQIVY